MLWDIRVVVGLDFGITYSGFSLSHVEDDFADIITNTEWPSEIEKLKTNTALRYHDGFERVESWGYPALYSNRKSNDGKTIELFNLYLGNRLEKFKPKLPGPLLTYKKAIANYLHEIGKLIKKTVNRWPAINFMENILLVLTVPAEYSEYDKAIMRECIFNAGLISDKHSERLQFTTESEATAIYCIYGSLREYRLTEPGKTFLIVDCGEENQITERAEDFCWSTLINKEFIKLLKREVGNKAIDLFEKSHFGQLQYIVQEFCQYVKMLFTGDDPDFNFGIDLELTTPTLLQYVTDSKKDSMEEKDWMIELNFDNIKSLFDPIIDGIIEMIRVQLDNSSGKCSAIFLVGSFGQSKYLQKESK